jgi:YD repeat-containing protein
LSSIAELSPANQVSASLAYGYDQKGRVASESRTVGGIAYVTAYAYDGAGRLAGITYPSGRNVAYAFDALGRVSQVTTTKDGQTQTVVQNVAYHPFGGAKGYTLGNGQSYVRGFDQDGRIASYSLAAQTFALGYDAASRIAFIADLGTPANSNTYSYDALDRLTQAVAPGTPFAYSYDAVGNRLSKTVGAATDSYSYGATSNRIASVAPATGPLRNFVFDANGSTTSDAVNQYSYDARGRMVQAVSAVGGSAYQVNALGQRVRKTNTLGESVFHYDTQGRLIAETDPAGTLKREVIYLGDIPVGVVR